MKNTVKIALGLLAGGSLIFLGLKRKNRKIKTFTAPDGNTYQENQTYRTFDNQLYKNGKKIHFSTPESEQKSYSSSHQYNENNDPVSKKYQTVNKEVNYHQKGIRHH
ncbi:hypothetical protein N6B72_13610 [Chryseobacterium soli]|uniref:Uncharacterized protein n=1 Tax=Chryseobacterium soli TaxID=445961 RepID=A0A086A2V1_9FLAO|nr:hypothetical protein [Chryseobacterium soli]KFF11015.1 hypothetical protein IW15_17775 [Chryseobacterium soli]MDV7697957.1 hypothetical protein [Chryseobacterium soli]